MSQEFPISLQEAVDFASTRWDSKGTKTVEMLRDELDRPGGKASVIQWFIDGMYATSGENVDARTLINSSSNAEIDEAFESVLNFLRGLGRSGVELAKSLRLSNRNLLENYKV
jgi:hypothetical protein